MSPARSVPLARRFARAATRHGKTHHLGRFARRPPHSLRVIRHAPRPDFLLQKVSTGGVPAGKVQWHLPFGAGCRERSRVSVSALTGFHPMTQEIRQLEAVGSAVEMRILRSKAINKLRFDHPVSPPLFLIDWHCFPVHHIRIRSKAC